MKKNDKIFVAGHRGLVGSQILECLKEQGYTNLITRTRKELDLQNQQAVADFFSTEKPEYVFLAAAHVGGIHANNTYPADFIMKNLQIECNVIDSSYKNKVKKLLFLGSSCIYPKLCDQPMKEEYLLNGELEKTNEAYAIAKIAGLKMCEYYNKQYGTNFISVMPTNLYGPNDNFDLENSHVLPALLRKVHEAKLNNSPTIEVWGSGKPLREFLYVKDMAEACIYIMENYNETPFLNIGTGVEISIRDLAETIKDVVGYDGQLVFNADKPDGTPRKLLDVSKLHNLGWHHKIDLKEGIEKTYEWYLRDEQ
ncbi:GDP-fucose synthetase [Candidatus Epulonipiscium fishelsonii]|uniref:GDP-fucose synthetase n=1 Tax=Candidatus Epulonipiscium fishelsonii TaxID=77094 RepID=A0ACC8XGD9_9FIRM|nr:GDP-fucose synthetase [Epulopiscium sp. SCG-B11WGA-EpuloA1]ONI42975.1 GDP-fucose synthetase [Epulopiscium sp. SCG-B05WGA-EpuloA1]